MSRCNHKEDRRYPHLNAKIVEVSHNRDNTMNIKLECDDCGSAWHLHECYPVAWEWDSSDDDPIEEVMFTKTKGLVSRK